MRGGSSTFAEVRRRRADLLALLRGTSWVRRTRPRTGAERGGLAGGRAWTLGTMRQGVFHVKQRAERWVVQRKARCLVALDVWRRHVWRRQVRRHLARSARWRQAAPAPSTGGGGRPASSCGGLGAASAGPRVLHGVLGVCAGRATRRSTLTTSDLRSASGDVPQAPRKVGSNRRAGRGCDEEALACEELGAERKEQRALRRAPCSVHRPPARCDGSVVRQLTTHDARSVPSERDLRPAPVAASRAHRSAPCGASATRAPRRVGSLECRALCDLR